MMELDGIECVSSSDGFDEDEIYQHHQFSSSKSRNATANYNNNNNNINNVIGSTAIAPATNVHELLECPVCTNSMYPPIHQVLCHEFLSPDPVLFVYWFFPLSFGHYC